MPESSPTLRDYYAAERTLLAWIRTAIALMGFGFVVARFGIFLRELTVIQNAQLLQSAGLSVWFGIALLAFGVVVNLMATRQYRVEIRMLNREASRERHTSALALWTGIGLALIGIAMAAYLIAISGNSAAGVVTK
jgi:putative membrane protein